MTEAKADIIARLQKDILPLQGLRSAADGLSPNMGLGTINDAFPNNCFPLGAIHEFLTGGPENAAASSGFIAGLLSSLMRNSGAALWISPRRFIFPPALKSFGITADRVVFIDVPKEKDKLWVMEEALKCSALSAVVAEIPEISFTNSRRLQLAVEQSRVTGFILRSNPRHLTTTAAVCRWQISSLTSEPEEGLPGVGFPRWKVELLKVRNGKPGSWEMMWAEGKFHHTQKPLSIICELQQKTG